MSLSNFQSDLNTALESEKPWSVTEAASRLRPSDIVFGSRSGTRKKGANKSGFPANRPVRTDEPVTRKLTIKLKRSKEAGNRQCFRPACAPGCHMGLSNWRY